MNPCSLCLTKVLCKQRLLDKYKEARFITNITKLTNYQSRYILAKSYMNTLFNQCPYIRKYMYEQIRQYGGKRITNTTILATNLIDTFKLSIEEQE